MDKGALLNPSAAPTDEVAISAGTVTVRGMSRAELGLATGDPLLNERRIIAACMIDPVLTEDEAAQWQSAPGTAGDILDVIDTINRLSGLKGRADKAEKEAYKSLRERPGE